jgi:hypothetical protein
MANLNDFNGKKGVSVFVAEGVPETDLGEVLGNIPENSLIVKTVVNNAALSSTSSSSVGVRIGGALVSSGIDATSAGADVSDTAVLLTDGGTVTVEAGGTAPAAGDYVFDVVVLYVEMRKTTGELTTV